jgi:hypothetical protein
MIEELEYLRIRANILLEMKLEDFRTWKYLDMFGNPSTEIQYKEDLRRELEKIERYDLLVEL